MATATVTTDNSTSAGSLPVTTNNETYRAYTKLDKDGKIADVKLVTAGKDGKTWKDLDSEASQNEGWVLYFEQSVREYIPNSWDACSQLIPEESERVAIFRAGLASKTDRKVKSALTVLTDDEKNLKHEPVQLFDTLDLIQEETQKRNQTPVEKAQKQIRMAVKAMFPTESDDFIEAKVAEMLGAMQGVTA